MTTSSKTLISLVVILAVFLGFSFLSNRQALKPQSILFYGDGCPHCEIVDTFIKENGIQDKMAFQKLEVFNNPGNASILSEKAAICGLDTKNIGVPFFWDGSKCYTGDEPIIAFFKQQTGIK